MLTPDDFVILDGRSTKDDTCLVYTANSRMPPARLRKDESAWDDSEMIYEWIEWRLRFTMAGHWIHAQHGAPALGDFELGPGMYFDDKGTLRMPDSERDESCVAGLTKEEKEACPWGPEKGVDNEFDDDEDPEDWEFGGANYVRCIEKGLLNTYPREKHQRQCSP